MSIDNDDAACVRVPALWSSISDFEIFHSYQFSGLWSNSSGCLESLRLALSVPNEKTVTYLCLLCKAPSPVYHSPLFNTPQSLLSRAPNITAFNDSDSMATVAAARARIKEISLAIKRQKEILRDLENYKRDAQSDLNSIRDPMARLPFELSSDIFMRCLADDTPGPHRNAAPMVFIRACRSWSKIAISTPSLWAAIRAEYPDARFGNLMDVWLARARNRPLSIALTVRGPFNSAVCQSVLRHAGQVHTLELYLPSGDDLERITTPFPSLKTLVIGQGPIDDEEGDSDDSGWHRNRYRVTYHSHNARESVGMLRAAPGLVDCKFDTIYYEVEFCDADYAEPDELTHLSLKHLHLDSSALILQAQHLTLPALETIQISTPVSHDPFLEFLTRSSPPLKSWGMEREMEIPLGLEPSSNTVFRLLPGLKDLRVTFSKSSSQPSFFLEELAVASPPQFLPNLRNLTISGEFTPDRSQYAKLISTLSARRASHSPMESFRLECVKTKPDADIITALQQLAADGMSIHVSTGFGGINLI
ncbi:hypothetical protein DFH09DRAFT_1389852 [Mycena vulgaris]|nr:hypothetical protein DFH09DRAFT_1389852 [Mycena vulgaris]